jgi:hypothetical protein
VSVSDCRFHYSDNKWHSVVFDMNEPYKQSEVISKSNYQFKKSKSNYITVNLKFVSLSSSLQVNLTFSCGFLIEKSELQFL